MKKKSRHHSSNQKHKKRQAADVREHQADTEFAADVSPVPVRPLHVEEDNDSPSYLKDGAVEAEPGSASKVLGWTALIVSLLSLFVFPSLLGPAGAVIGFFSFMQGSRTLGAWAMILGLVSLFVALFLSPFY